jgi:UDP-N-acetylmuramate--alanine ligase
MTHVHFIGIGGSGLSAIARLLLESGYTVSGSDRALTPFAEELRKAGAKVYVGHHPRNLTGADWVVRSSAVTDDNPEVQGAQGAGIPVYKRADFLGRLMQDKTGIAIAGTHGKTTTTAMTAWVLSQLGRDPSFIVGGTLNNLGVNAHAGKGHTFVIEADEYDNMFLGLKPQIAVVTSLEHDHPDFFPTFASMYRAFERFVDMLPADGTLIACADDAGAAALIPHARKQSRSVISYGLQNELTINSPFWVQARDVQTNTCGGFDFTAVSNLSSKTVSMDVSLQVPGQHNILNALAVLAIVGELGLSRRKAAHALGEFTGTGRRFELRGDVNGIRVYDDYAHHPTEIRATLAGARARFPQARIWAVWQPHTYSRTKTLFLDFARAFKDANEVIVTEVYAAREPEETEFTSAEVISAMPHFSARYIKTLPEVTEYLLEHLQPGDVVLVLSAGDADKVSADVVKALQER